MVGFKFIDDEVESVRVLVGDEVEGFVRKPDIVLRGGLDFVFKGSRPMVLGVARPGDEIAVERI